MSLRKKIMKLTISIPNNALSDVEEYCRIEGIDFEARIQQEVDRFVNNAIKQMEQRREIKDDIGAIAKAFEQAMTGVE